MKTKLVKLDDETKDVLLRSGIEGCELRLPEQLDRSLYKLVAKCIKAAGGKWVRGKGCHVFPHPVRETLGIGADTVEVTDVQQTFQSFYTPDAVADELVAMLELRPHHAVLEPSAGEGALLKACIRAGTKARVAVEIDLRKKPSLLPHCDTVCIADFMDVRLGEVGGLAIPFDAVAMNPPFTGGADIHHIKHALTFLKPGGLLAAICGNGPKQRRELEPLATVWRSLAAGAFKKSGTNVSVAMLLIEA